MEIPRTTFVMLPPHRGKLNSSATQTNISIEDLCENKRPVQIILENTIKMKGPDNENDTHKSDHEVLLHRRLNPKSKSDFKQLYRDIGNWRGLELKKVNSIQEKQFVLDNELKLLQKVENLKVAERKCSSKEKLQTYLSDMSNDLVWETSLGEKIRVETSSKLYASKLARIYVDLRDFENQEGKEISYQDFHRCLYMAN